MLPQIIPTPQITLGSTVLAFGSTTTAVSGLASLGITAPAANSTALTLSGGSHTGTDATSDISIATTWNVGTATPTAVLLNVTKTAAGAAALLADFQLSGASKFSVAQIGATGNAISTNNFFGVYDTYAHALAFGSTGLFSYIATAGGMGLISVAGQYGLAASGANPQSPDTWVTRSAAAALRLGQADAAAPVAQALGVQNVSSGTTNTAGANFTITASKGTGTGAGGQMIFQTAPGAASTNTTTNAFATALTLTAPTGGGKQPSVVVGNQALSTNSTDGFLYIPSGAGAPTGTPTTFTGRVPLYFDTTNNQFWIYDGSWLQPKTAGAISLVSWQ